MSKHISSLHCLNSVQNYCRLFKKMLVTSEGRPYLRCYNCPRRAFQTLPRSPLSSMLQLLTSHPGKINGLTMQRPSPLTDIDRHIQTLAQKGWEQRRAYKHVENCWAHQCALSLAISQCFCFVWKFNTQKSWSVSSICVIWISVLCWWKELIPWKRQDSGVFEEHGVSGKSTIPSLLGVMVTSLEVVFVPVFSKYIITRL